MIVAGLEKNSLVDYPGKVAAVVFTQGCNLRCWYCHNQELIPTDGKAQVNPDFLNAFLEARKDLLGGVVVTGGEPTLQPDLLDFLEQLKGLGYEVKLDTNGTRPDVLFEAIKRDLVDYVAMDIKAPAATYHMVTGRRYDPKGIETSVRMLMTGKTSYEFRTTCHGSMTLDCVEAIAREIRGASAWYLQQYRPPASRQNFIQPRPHQPAWFREALERGKLFVPNTFLRGVDLEFKTA